MNIGKSTGRRGVRVTARHLLKFVRDRQGLVDLLTDGRIAFAGALFERATIDDLNEPATIADHPGGLQDACDDRHRGPANAEHLAEKFLSERYRIAFHAVMGLQQPSAKSRL